MALWFPKNPTWPALLGKRRISRLQHTLNVFFATHMTGIAPLRVDGEMGPATRKHIRLAKFYIGMVKPGRFSGKVNRQFMKRLRQPNNPRLVIGANPGRTVQRGKNRRATHDRLYKESQHHYSGLPHWVTFDGKMVAAYAEPSLYWARNTGYGGMKWRGTVTSGGRTAAYSEHLCFAMCGAPSCPGRCAGKSSNHVGNNPRAVPCGAVDVSDYARFKYLMVHCPFQALGTVRIFNDLPIDPVHFSPTGR